MSSPHYSTETLDRIKKLERIRALGVNPFATKFDITDSIGNILRKYPSNIDPTLEHSDTPTLRKIEDIIPAPVSTVSLSGRVMLHRSFGKICFATISDGTGRMQILFSRENCQINVNGISKTDLAPVILNEVKDPGTSGTLDSSQAQNDGTTETVSAYKFAEKLIDLGDFIGVKGELFYTHK